MTLEDRHRALAAAMDAQGLWPTESDWVRRAILEALPRHSFAPGTLWAWNGVAYVPVERAERPEEWAALVYGGPYDSTITQVRDGLPSSSLSCVSVVADMLDSLEVEPGQRVLELGTGAGWNAALLAERAGPGLVTTVEVDARLASAARHRLERAGLDVAIHVGDGNAGRPGEAPYDRLVSTYAVDRIPWAWVEQTRPGGRIVTPWGRLGHVALTVADDGRSATGWMQGLAMFMPRRGADQGRAFHQVRADSVDSAGRGFGTLRRDPRLLGDPHLLFALRVSLPDVRINVSAAPDGFTVEAHDGHHSWAVRSGNDREFRGGGPRPLLAEIEAAWDHWEEYGSPDLFDFGMTVGRDRQYVWCGSADSGPWDDRQ
ncbi:methyltransferase domain-containing protein [Streptomyces sp. NBC_00239]|uniref:methyltransferase domain-containing protein n=1 Tax=Streptomyces sp. NBC_00239 TaxID=2903640 RepID=UPI002E2D2DC5|nr:methyltransferase domain-containing protein [Streptomyces sp. NBC_00239]